VIEVIKFGGLTLLGQSGQFISASHEGSDAPQVIGRLWQEMSKVFFALDLDRDADPLGIGAMWPTESGKPGEMIYFAGYQIHSKPDLMGGLEILDLPMGTYAQVIHQGPMSELPQTVTNFYAQLLPASQLERVAGFDLEIYYEVGQVTKVGIAAPVRP
jgi:predicted transcriptional regulator YdeE